MNGLKQFDCHFKVDKILDPEEGGPNIGIFEGFASTFGNVDRQDDVMVKGAFKNTLDDHDDRNRQIRMLSGHNRFDLIGGFPISKAKKEDRGLFVEGHVNLDTQSGAESFSLMKQGVLTDMSIGFRILDSEMNDGRQFIKDVELFEISLVTEPANQEAQITAIKSIIAFQDLPLASNSMIWNSDTARNIMKEFSAVNESKSSDYNSSFLWCDDTIDDDAASHKMQIGTLVDGEIKAVPRAIFTAAASIQGQLVGAQIPSSARPGIVKNIERYYEKMGRESPFEKGFSPDEMKSLSRGELVKFLRSQPLLSKSGAEYLSQGIMGGSGDQVAEKQADGLRKLSTTLTSILKEE